MRKLLIGLGVGIILAATADARVLVIAAKNVDDTNPSLGNLRNTQTQRAAVVGMLNRAGVDYDLIGVMPTFGRPGGFTEMCRRGVVTYNCCGADSFTRSYEAVIHIITGVMNGHGSNWYRPDSLFSSTKLPLVPQLMLTNQYTSFSSACGCSTAVNGSQPGYNGSTNYLGWTQVYREKVELRYRSGFVDGFASTTSKHGTVRFLVSGASNAAHAQTNRPTVPLPCIDCDSLLNPATDDSGVVIIEHNDHVPGKKPIIICGSSHSADDQFDGGTMFMGLAVLDSVCGGTIIKKPLQFSINIRGGFRRNDRAMRGGISPDDSTALKASIDSVASLGVPFTVGVNLDSVATYAAEKFWWQRTPFAHFAPESWSGIAPASDTTHLTSGTGGGGANYGSSIDIWGRFRSRTAVGPMDNPDTSLANLIRVSLARTDSLFPGKLDKAGMAAAFDWGPRNIGAIGYDSLWYAIGKGGLSTVVFETQNFLANPSQTTNPLGFLPQQTRMRSSLGGESIRVLGTPQSPDSGSAIVEGGHTNDSFGNNPQNSWCKNTESFWAGMLGTRMIGQSNNAGHQSEADLNGVMLRNNFSACSILTIHAGDLGSGLRSDAAQRPTHPGWWAIKSVVNQAKIANALAGRIVVAIKYTQDLDP
jgi:hypothetical protein